MILGGNGYLGSKIVRALIHEENAVVCTRREQSDLSRVADMENKITWIQAAVDNIDAVLQHINFDYVINLACNYGRSNGLYDDVIEANLEFPLKVLNKAVEYGTMNFLTIGTGLPDEFNMYSFSKKTYADFGRFYTGKHGINFVDIKLEMMYGADEPENRFLPSVVRKMVSGKDVETTIGMQKRDIIAVDDVVKAILLVINADLKGYHEISVGTGISPSISQIIDFIWEETGRKSKVNKGAIPMRRDEPNCIADITFLQSLGTWNPIDWKTGIRRMIDMIKTEVSEK